MFADSDVVVTEVVSKPKLSADDNPQRSVEWVSSDKFRAVPVPSEIVQLIERSGDFRKVHSRYLTQEVKIGSKLYRHYAVGNLVKVRDSESAKGSRFAKIVAIDNRDNRMQIHYRDEPSPSDTWWRIRSAKIAKVVLRHP
jgi:hypothetical protein